MTATVGSMESVRRVMDSSYCGSEGLGLGGGSVLSLERLGYRLVRDLASTKSYMSSNKSVTNNCSLTEMLGQTSLSCVTDGIRRGYRGDRGSERLGLASGPRLSLERLVDRLVRALTSSTGVDNGSSVNNRCSVYSSVNNWSSVYSSVDNRSSTKNRSSVDNGSSVHNRS